jgi:hypothetical protein
MGMAPAYPIGSYAPLMVISFGFERLKSNAMLSIGTWFLVLTNLVWGFVADKTQRRGLMVFLGVIILWALMVRLFPSTTSDHAVVQRSGVAGLTLGSRLQTACSLHPRTGT